MISNLQAMNADWTIVLEFLFIIIAILLGSITLIGILIVLSLVLIGATFKIIERMTG